MRHEGHHETQARSRESWNQQFFAKAAESITSAWHEVEATQQRVSQEMMDLLAEAVGAIPGKMCQQRTGIDLVLEPFKAVIKTSQTGMVHAYHTHQKDVSRGLKSVSHVSHSDSLLT